ncbi:MAG: MFS transporter [Nocardioidaceae bacterium]|nr:MFS transporter [Nocardioidaceae bacterium]
MTTVLRARNAVVWSFMLNGFGFASWASRIPEVREGLSLTNAELGLLLLVLSVGSVTALPTSGALVHRFGVARVVQLGVALDVLGLVGAGVAADVLGSVVVTGAFLVSYGVGVAVWDVAMNVEGAAVEHGLGRSIMPRFHAAWSVGSVSGALLGAAAVGIGLPMVWHLIGAAAVMVAITIPGTGSFLPSHGDEPGVGAGAEPALLAAWLEPRTLLIGAMMLSLALTEGIANDWLAVALIDGYDVAHWVGVAGFGLFVMMMTLGRFFGPILLDRHGRVAVLWATMASAGAGVLLIVYGGSVALVAAGIVMWGVGASLGFPVGISAASDDPTRAAARVSVVSSIAYAAFLAGPPIIGFIANHVGTLHSLLFVSLLLIPSALVVPAARERR